MPRRMLEIVNEKGLHARASARFVETVDRFEADAIVRRDGLELRYHIGEPGNWVGVKKHKGVRKTSYQARISITKRKGNARRQYGLGSFGSAEEAAIAIARERLKEEGPFSPQGDRKPRTCA